ncbi:MAG: DUF4307 domain-containing protein [Micromonosporaceae bacterium]
MPDQLAAEPTFPAGRYGRRRQPRPARRWVAVLLATLVIIAGLAISLQLYRQYGDPTYQPKVLTFTIGDGEVTIRFQVYKPGGQPATCIVRARAANGEEVGRAEVAIPAGSPDSDSVTVTYTLATSREPVTGEVVGCAPAGT